MQIKRFKDIFFLVLFFYLIISTLIFAYFISQKPPFIYDQTQYYNLATDLIKNHFNIFTTNFHDRTFVYPTFLALVRLISSLGKILQNPLFGIGNLSSIYFANLLLFHGANLLIFASLYRLSKKYSLLFLFFSSFNVINLSIMPFLLTETLSIFLVSLIFYLLSVQQQTRRWFFSIGLIGSLFIYTRPNTLIFYLFIAFFLGIKYFRKKDFLFFLIGSLLIFLIGISNTYILTGKLRFFTDDVLSDSVYAYKYGINFFEKTENIETKFSWDGKFYHSDMLFTNLRNFFLDHNCFTAIQCQLSYLTQNPKTYFSMLLVHLFTAFDKTYLINVYIKDISAINNYVRLGNYLVLSSAIIYLFLFQKDPKIKIFIKFAVATIILNVLPFLPGMVEPRYSTPIYPLVLALSCFYLTDLKTATTKQKIIFLSFQAVIILLFFTISNAILDTLHIGRWGY